MAVHFERLGDVGDDRCIDDEKQERRPTPALASVMGEQDTAI